jgi:uncharacterized protein DUF5689
MKKRTSILLMFAAIIAATTFMISCKKEFDSPPFYVVPNITANKTLATFKARYTTTGTVVTITDSSIISGIVVANDQSGNIYKEIFIQDSTGGIALKLNGTNLYTSFPVGMRVYIKCQGLALSDYNNDMELGAIDNTIPSNPAVTGIPQNLITQYVVAGSLNNTIVPKVVTLAQLAAAANKQPYLDTLQNTLIQVPNAEFAATDTGFVYSDTSANKSSVSRNLEDCSGGKTVLYTSGYADFAGVKLPSGNGTITAVYTPYKTSSELILPDTSDIKFTGSRCTGGSSNLITLATLRSMYSSSTVSITNSTQITGVVISDVTNKNVSSGDVIIQQGNYGISVYLGGTITYHVGDSVVFDITGGSLQKYQGSLEVEPASGYTKPSAVATGKVITPSVMTVQQLKTSLASSLSSSVEFTLVTINSATASGGATFSGNKTLTDASSNMTLYTATGATFAATALPTGAHNWTGYGSNFNTTPQFQIRNTSDVQ